LKKSPAKDCNPQYYEAVSETNFAITGIFIPCIANFYKIISFNSITPSTIFFTTSYHTAAPVINNSISDTA